MHADTHTYRHINILHGCVVYERIVYLGMSSLYCLVICVCYVIVPRVFNAVVSIHHVTVQTLELLSLKEKFFFTCLFIQACTNLVCAVVTSCQ